MPCPLAGTVVSVAVSGGAVGLVSAGGASVDGLTLTTLGPLPPLQMDPSRAPILERYRRLAHSRYGQTVTSDGPAWSTWP